MMHHSEWQPGQSKPAMMPSSPQCRMSPKRAEWLPILLCLLLPLPVFAQGDEPKLEDKVDQFLERMGLIDFQILHLKKQLSRPGTARDLYASKLADLYVNQLLNINEAAEAAKVIQEVQALLKRFPKVKTPLIQVMLLQGEYQRAEEMARKWMSDPDANAKARGEAQAILARIVPFLTTYHGQLHRQVQREGEIVDNLPEGAIRSRRERRLNRLTNVAGRASYFAGWGNYYLGLIKNRSGANGKAEYLAARKSFRRLFFEEDKDQVTKESQAEEYDLLSEARARAALGLALTEIALGEKEVGGIWFGMLRSADASPEVRDEVGYWQVLASLNAEDYDQAAEIAAKEIESFTDAFTPGRVSLCVLLMRAGYKDPKSQKPKLGQLGLQGLLKLRRFALARKLLNDYGIGTTGNGFILIWLNGQNQMDKARKSGAKGDYQQAIQTFQSALKASDASGHRDLMAECRYSMAWCHYQIGELKQSADLLKEAAPVLKAARSGMAADALWMLAGTYLSLARKDKSYQAEAEAVLKRFKEDFPSHANASKAEILLATMSGKTIDIDGLDPKAANYPDACLQALRQTYAKWQKLRNDPTQGPSVTQKLKKTIDIVVDVPALQKRPTALVEAQVMGAQIALLSTPPQLKEAQKWIAKADGHSDALANPDKAATDYHYWKMQIAKLSGDSKTLLDQAEWLADHRPGTQYGEVGLITMAQAVEKQIQSATNSEKKALEQKAYQVYDRLSKALGRNESALKSKKNALIAASRFAKYASKVGKHSEAISVLEAVLKLHPRDARYIRLMALTQTATGKDQEKALALWRKLVNGLKKNSDEWYEAKYYHMKVLFALAPEEARKEFRQFKLLRPDLGPPNRRDLFKELEKTLSP